MRKLATDDVLGQIRERGSGFIYNDYSGKGQRGKDYNILHAAKCPRLDQANAKRKFFCENLDNATSWLAQNRGPEDEQWKRCAACLGSLQPIEARAMIPTKSHDVEQVNNRRTDPFAEPEVERLLIEHLQANGFDVKPRYRVHSGIIDLAARNANEQWLIEVKGEDRGGYGSAEMNFQMGIGQLVSRMTESGIKYALAFPVTEDYKRVLRKYRGSFGFERLGLRFFGVHRDNVITAYDASALADMIATL
ncbi:MAG: hypothetical protein KJZ93_12645 [Caldilineaceae bacterium]|nr:hypothetical protein [Caldilineaceae bacterium]